MLVGINHCIGFDAATEGMNVMVNKANTIDAMISEAAAMERQQARSAAYAKNPTFVVVNGKQIDVAVKGLSFDAICQEMIEATEKQYGSHIRIAAKLNELLPFAWYDVDPQEVSDEAKALDVHKKPLYAALKKAGHTNPSVPFGRMRDYGRNLRAGLSPNGKTMADGSAIPNNVSTDGEGEGANPAKRSPVLRNIDELVKLWKANDKLGKDAPSKVVAAQPHIEAALKALGVDVRTVK